MHPVTPETGLVIVAHGERTAAAANRALLAHATRVAERWPHIFVRAAVLYGEPSLRRACRAAAERGVRTLLVYPFFITDGVGQMLAKHLGELARCEISLMPPFGFDPALPTLLLKASLSAAGAAGFLPGGARLLIVAHGRRPAREPAAVIARMTADLRSRDIFASVESAFLEQHPFLRDVLKSRAHPTVVAGCFAGEGLHACVDVPAAVEKAGKDALYTGPIGAHPKVADLIIHAVADALTRLPHAATNPIYHSISKQGLRQRPCSRGPQL